MKFTLGKGGHIVVVQCPPRNCAPAGLRALRAADKARYIKTLRDTHASPASLQRAKTIVKLDDRCSAGSSCIGLPPAGGEDFITAPANMTPPGSWEETTTSMIHKSPTG